MKEWVESKFDLSGFKIKATGFLCLSDWEEFDTEHFMDDVPEQAREAVSKYRDITQALQVHDLVDPEICNAIWSYVCDKYGMEDLA